MNDGTVLLKVNDPNRLYVSSDVTEIDVNKLEAGMPAVVTFDSLSGQEFEGQIATIANYAEEKERQRVEQRVFEVMVTFSSGRDLGAAGHQCQCGGQFGQGRGCAGGVALGCFYRGGAVNMSSWFRRTDRSRSGRSRRVCAMPLTCKSSGVDVGDELSLVRPDLGD